MARRINLLLLRRGHSEIELVPRTSDPNQGTSSFLTRNIQKVLALRGGCMLILPPFIPIIRAIVIGGYSRGQR